MSKRTKTLDVEQIALLRKQITGHGKLSRGAKQVKVSRWTIYNALAGKPLKFENYLALIPLILKK